MTLTDERVEPSPTAEAAPPEPVAEVPPRTGVPAGALVAVSLGFAAALVLGFFAYLLAFSGLSEARAQHALRQSFARQLRDGIAPVGPVPAGRPVALLDIPAIHLNDVVVVEGSSSRNLMNGPGHLPATVLPGQAGVSTILGKGTTFGAPFRSLLDLQPGDRITATTGQGVNSYVVSSFGDSVHPPPANSVNRLVLETGSGGGAPDRVVIVSADLVSPVQLASTPAAASAVDRPRARDLDDSLVPLAGWSQLLLLCAIVGTGLMYRGPRWPTVLCLGPIVLAVVWNVYENAAGLLPNVV